MRRGELYWALLEPRSGSEQKGRRPVVLISHNGFNEVLTWRSVIVLPVTTSSRQQRRGPTVVTLDAGTGGLLSASAVLCHQVTTLDRSKLGQLIGVLPAEALKRVEVGIMSALDLFLR